MTLKSKKKKIEANVIINSGLLVCLLIYATIVTLLLFRNFFENFKPECAVEDEPEFEDVQDLPYLPATEDDFLALLTPSDVVQCFNLEYVSTPKINGRPHLEDGMEGVHVCMDTLPQPRTPNTCRIYSLDPNPNNVYFELKLGRTGCRVHLITKATELNYGRIGNNSYLYPLHISADDGPSHYSIDNYINLMSHETKMIQLVKTANNGSEWRFLTTLYTSKTEAWRQIQQLRLVVHVPPLSNTTRDEFSHKYLLLRGLHSLGYELVYSKPLLLQGELIPEEHSLAPRYETIWLKIPRG